MQSAKRISIFVVGVAISLASFALPWTPATARAEPALKGYTNYDALKTRLDALAQSGLVSLSSLGRTLGGREVFLLAVGSGPADAKPAILVVGGVHAPHLVGSELAVQMIEKLVDRAKHDEATRKFLEQVTLYVIPRPSPDAAEYFFAPKWERATNERATDDDRDGELDEDPPNDLNGDGLITMMRVADPGGKYITHPDDIRVLIEADPRKDEQGVWTLYTEGIDDDGDDATNEDGPGGVDFNHNFTHRYPYFEAGAGPHQVSEVETRAVADFAFSRPNIAVVFSLAPEDNLMNPWKPNSGSEGSRFKTAIRNGDAPYADLVSERFRKIQEGKGAPPSPDTPGGFVAWAYFHYGRWSFASRGWWVPDVPAPTGQPPEPDDGGKDEKRGQDQVRALRWLAHEKIDGFVPWQPVDHPDFPGKKVEVGGFKPYVLLNPPADAIPPLAEKHARFLVELGGLLPRIKLREPKVEALGQGVYRLTATAANDGYLPTVSVMGKESGHVYPVQLELLLPDGMKLLAGTRRVELPPLAGKGAAEKRSWLILAGNASERAATVKAYSPSVGHDEQTVELK